MSFTFTKCNIVKAHPWNRMCFILFYGWVISIIWLDHTLCIRSSAGKHLGCFYLLAFMNNAATNLCKCLLEYLFSVLLVREPEWICESYGYSIFNWLRSCQNCLHCPWYLVRSRQQGDNFPFKFSRSEKTLMTFTKVKQKVLIAGKIALCPRHLIPTGTPAQHRDPYPHLIDQEARGFMVTPNICFRDLTPESSDCGIICTLVIPWHEDVEEMA